ncbi:pseudouridine synthase [Pacificimonas flava]|uniref:Pseudouridine synthase n=2 Tax=Pacificimonas TaxID=1960290 RepID=A0A219B743_9SPHN|nr:MULTISPECIES: pseudouridine synthase [Pacificimonas]MBZ6378635.1 rRNA pseudouridine synthase [Pacificimonas aurantium]OWV34091.1 pseudouridine synthase [Pacificimonas flava]
MADGERIAKLMARAGAGSRREVERMIGEGRVALDGKTLTSPALNLPSLRGVTLDGEPLGKAERTRLWRLHKPAGTLTTERDPKGRPTVFDKLPKDMPRVSTVGRLDFNTEGLLLLTNDGELKRALELPKNAVQRRYRVRVFGDVHQAELERLAEGVTIDGVHYRSIEANIDRKSGRYSWLSLALTEGKNREVRRVLDHLGLQVTRLIRTGFGPFELEDLKTGAVEALPPAAVAEAHLAIRSSKASKA